MPMVWRLQATRTRKFALGVIFFLATIGIVSCTARWIQYLTIQGDVSISKASHLLHCSPDLRTLVRLQDIGDWNWCSNRIFNGPEHFDSTWTNDVSDSSLYPSHGRTVLPGKWIPSFERYSTGHILDLKQDFDSACVWCYIAVGECIVTSSLWRAALWRRQHKSSTRKFDAQFEQKPEEGEIKRSINAAIPQPGAVGRRAVPRLTPPEKRIRDCFPLPWTTQCGPADSQIDEEALCGLTVERVQVCDGYSAFRISLIGPSRARNDFRQRSASIPSPITSHHAATSSSLPREPPGIYSAGSINSLHDPSPAPASSM